MKFSDYNIQGDLRYLDLDINSTNKVIGNFTIEDIGKTILIYKAYHNPKDVAHIPNTTKGRIVAVKTTILDVIGNEATIGVTLNQSGTTRGYVCTDNSQELQTLINDANNQGVTDINCDVKGIVGVDLTAINEKNYLYVNGSLRFNGISKLKCINENINEETGFFALNIFDGEFELNIPCLPANEFHGSIQKQKYYIVSCNEFGGNAGDSRRTIKITNQDYNPNDLDNFDAFWTDLVLSSGGNQDFIIDTYIRTKNGGVTIFSQTGYENSLYLTGHIEYSNNYEGENGRDGLGYLDNPCKWYFSNFEVIDGVVHANGDFSFYDYEKTLVFPTVNGKKITNIIDAHTAEVSGLTNGVQDVEIGLFNRDFYDHPLYCHPSLKAEIFDFTHSITSGYFKFYSEQGTVDSSIGSVRIENSTINRFEVENGTPLGTRTKVEIINSNIEASSIGGYLTVQGSYIGGNISSQTFENRGNNRWNITNGKVFESTYFKSIGEQGWLNLIFKAPNAQVYIENHHFDYLEKIPVAQEGTTYFINCNFDESSQLGVLDLNRITENAKIKLVNCKQSRNDNFDLLQFEGMNVVDWEWENSNIPSNIKGFKPFNQPNTHKNNGCITVTNDFKDYYALVTYENSFSRWNDNNANRFAVINPLESSHHIIDGEEVSGVIASFNTLKKNSQQTVGLHDKDASDYHVYNRWMLMRGFITIEFRNGAKINPFLVTTLGRDGLCNVIQRNVEREHGEIVTFKIDNSNGTLIEVSSSVDDHYITSIPQRRGLENEVLFMNNNNVVQYEQTKTQYSGLIIEPTIIQDSNTSLQLGKSFDGDFEFTIIYDDGTEESFTYRNDHNHNRKNYNDGNYHLVHIDYTKWFYEYISDDKEAYFDRYQGTIVINGIVNNIEEVRVTGTEISGHWQSKKKYINQEIQEA